MFVRLEGEDIARNDFRRALDCMMSEGRGKKIKGVIKNSDNNIYKRNFPQEVIN
jgi:hypothetical protein